MAYATSSWPSARQPSGSAWLTGRARLRRKGGSETALPKNQARSAGEWHLAACPRHRAALSAMRYLREFSPRLVGAVLSGTATLHSEVQLHLFAERAESVTLKLLDEGIPHEVTERRLRFDAEQVRAFPGVRFEMDAQP